MDIRNWKRVLLLWMSEFDYTNKSTSNVEQSDVEAFFEYVRCNHNFMQKEKNEVQLIQFLNEHYNAYHPHVDDQNEMSSADYVYVYSLLLHFTCVKQPEVYFQEKCNKLPDSAQKAIALFFKLILECSVLNKENLRHIIGEVANACQLKSSPVAVNETNTASSSPSSPMKTPLSKTQARISPSTPKTVMLDERTRELISLRTELENERYEKSILEIQIKENELKINKLSNDCKRLQQKLLELKTNMNGNDNESSPSTLPDNEGQEQTKRRLTRDIKEKEAEISKLTDMITTLRDEKSTLKEQLTQAEKHIKICMDRIQESDCKIFQLTAELHEQNSIIKNLNEHKGELERYISEIKPQQTANNSSDCLDVSFQNNSSSPTTSPENLGCSVIDKQLREKSNEVNQLREELNKARCNNMNIVENIKELMAVEDMQFFDMSNSESFLKSEVTENTDALEYLQAFGKDFKELTNSYKKDQQNLRKLEQNSELLCQKNEELNERLTEAEEQINSLNQKIDNMDIYSDDLRRDKEILELSLNQYKKDIAELTERKYDLVAKFECLSSEYDTHKENCQALQNDAATEIGKLQAQLLASERKQKCLNEHNNKLDRELNNLQIKLQEAHEEAIKCRNNHKFELQALTERFTSMKAEYDRHHTAEIQLKESHEKLLSQMETLKKNAREADTHLAAMRAKLNEKEREMFALGEEIKEVRTSNIEKESRIELLVSSFKNERERMTEKLKEYEAKYQHIVKVNEQMEGLHGPLKKEHDAANELLVSQEKELQSISNKLADISQTVLVPLIDKEFAMSVEDIGNKVRDLIAYKEQSTVLIEELRNENELSQRIRLEMETKNIRQKEAFERQLTELNDEKNQIVEEQAELLRKSKEEMSASINEKREHFVRMEKELKAVIAKHNDAQVCLQKSEVEIKELKNDKEKHLKNLELLEKDKIRFHKQVEELKKQLTDLKKELSVQKECYNVQQKNISEHDEKLTQKKQRIKQLLADQDKVSKQLEAQKVNNGKLEKERNASADELKNCKEIIKSQKQQLEQLRKDNKQKLLEIKLIETERNNKILENTQMEMEHNKKICEMKQNWDRRSKTQQMDIEHWQRKAQMLSEEVDQCQHEIANIEKQNSAELEEKIATIWALEKSLEQMQLSVADKNLSSEKLMNEIEEKENELKKEQLANENLEKEIKSQSSLLKGEITALKEELQKERDAMEQLTEEHKKLKIQLKEQEQKLTAKTAEWKEKLEVEQNKLNRLSVANNDLEKRLAEQEKINKEDMLAATEKIKRLNDANKEYEKRLAAQEQKSKEQIAAYTEKILQEQEKWRQLNASINELEKRLAVQEQKAKEKIDVMKEELLKVQDKLRILSEVAENLKKQLANQEVIAKEATDKMNSLLDEVNMEQDVIKRYKLLNVDLKRQLKVFEDKSKEKIAALTAELHEEQSLMKRLDDALTSVIITLENVTNLSAETDPPKEDIFRDTRDLPELKRCLNKVVHKLKQKEKDINEMEKQRNSECKAMQNEMDRNLGELESQLKESSTQLEEVTMQLKEMKERHQKEQKTSVDQERTFVEMRKLLHDKVCENKKLEKDFKELHKNVCQLEDANKEFSREITMLSELNQAGLCKEAELSKENARLQDELKKWQTKLSECESKVVETMEARIELDKIISQNEEEDKKALKSQQELTLYMQERNQKLQNDVVKYLAEVEKLNEENNKYKETLEAQTKRIEKLSLKLGETQANGDRLERELNKAKDSQVKLESQNEILKNENDLLKKDSKVLKERLQQFDSAHAQQVAKIVTLESSLKNNKVAEEKLQKDYDDLRVKIIKLEKHREANDQKIYELEEELGKGEKEIVRLQLENGALNSELAEKNTILKRQVNDDENMKEAFEHEFENLREILEKHQLALAIAQREKSELEQQILTLRAEKSSTEEEHLAVLNKLREAGKKAEQLCEERSQALKKQDRLIEELQEQLSEKKKSCHEMQEKITKLISCEVQQSNLNTDLEHLRVRLNSAEELLEKELQITAQLRTDNQILQAKYGEAKQRLQDEHQNSEERIKENRLELEGKLEKMKLKMKTLYSEEITKMKSKQDRETMALKTEIEKLHKQNAKYEEHTRKLASQIMLSNDNILEQQRQRAILSTKLKHLEESEDMRFKRPSSMHLAALPSAVTSSIPSSNLGSNLTMEDEEGEIFNNTYLTDLKAGRMSDMMGRNICPEELQYRNSLVPPHLKSAYAAQYDNSLAEDEVKDGPNSFDDSMSGLLTGGGVRKKISGATHYKRPGPPTPSKNGGRLSLGGNSEPPREILKEYNDGGLSTVKTPARFGFFGSRFSMGKDENTPPKRRLSSMFKRK